MVLTRPFCKHLIISKPNEKIKNLFVCKKGIFPFVSKENFNNLILPHWQKISAVVELECKKSL
jgi:hypothetical protein